MRIQGIPFDQAKTHGTIDPYCGVLHRTYGGWNGDYSVGKNTPGGVGFHLLVGKLAGQQVQFADTTQKCWHSGGWPNSYGVGIEFTGRNYEPLTDWQVMAGANMLKQLRDGEGIPLAYYHGTRIGSGYKGWLTHASVLNSDHTDMVTRTDWDRMVNIITASDQKPIDWVGLRRLVAAKVLASLREIPTPQHGGSPPSFYISVIKDALNQQVTDLHPLDIRNISYDDALIQRVWHFQQAINAIRPGAINEFPGSFGDQTKWWLAMALQNIVDGKA